ncbi:MAG: pantoate--beta-alanine ligase [Bacteroidota bacterium]
MLILKTIEQVRAQIEKGVANGLKIGFVPTMGALHQGHISLITKAKKENDLVVASIFVNPTQFNDPTDLINYPKTPEQDHSILEKNGCDILFEPTADEIYDDSYDPPAFDFGILDKTMEGAQRPGHFKGVAMVVYRLFQIIPAHRAYFGEKDYQQLAIIRKMADDQKLPIQIIACPTIREADGLAMSSRNIRLTAQERKLASVIFESLIECNNLINSVGLSDAKKTISSKIEATGVFKIEYVEIADAQTLQPIERADIQQQMRVFIAAKASKTRLIDNMGLRF